MSAAFLFLQIPGKPPRSLLQPREEWLITFLRKLRRARGDATPIRYPRNAAERDQCNVRPLAGKPVSLPRPPKKETIALFNLAPRNTNMPHQVVSCGNRTVREVTAVPRAMDTILRRASWRRLRFPLSLHRVRDAAAPGIRS